MEKHLSEDDRKEYQSYLNLEQLRKDSLHAKARLAKEAEGGRIAPEERQRLENRIASFGYYATHWNDHMQSVRKSQEFKKEVDELPERLVDEADRTNNPNLLIGISPMKETAERRFLKPDPVMLEELRSDVRFAKGEQLQKNVETFETQLRDAVRQSRESRAIVQKAGMNYTGEVSPKQLSEEWHNLEVSSWKLDTLLKETGGRLDKAIISEIYDTYNQTAREKGWKELLFGEKDSLRMSLLKVDNRMRDPEMVDEELPADKGTIESIIRKIGKRAGVTNCHPHRFRRTGATVALRSGMPIQTVSKLLGHNSIETTQIYLDVSDEELGAAHAKYVI